MTYAQIVWNVWSLNIRGQVSSCDEVPGTKIFLKGIPSSWLLLLFFPWAGAGPGGVPKVWRQIVDLLFLPHRLPWSHCCLSSVQAVSDGIQREAGVARRLYFGTFAVLLKVMHCRLLVQQDSTCRCVKNTNTRYRQKVCFYNMCQAELLLRF